MTMAPAPERAVTYFDDAPRLNRQDALAKFDAWRAGLVVSSTAAAVGRLTLTPDEYLFVSSARLVREPYTMLKEGSPAAERLSGLRTAFLEVVDKDMEASGLGGRVRKNVVFAGNYGPGNQEPWHSDDHQDASVRYVVAFGDAGSTRSATGTVSSADIERNNVNGGDLLPHVGIGPGQQLEEAAPYAEGTIVRFMNIADIHAGPVGSGARIMLQATVLL